MQIWTNEIRFNEHCFFGPDCSFNRESTVAARIAEPYDNIYENIFA